MGLDKFAEDIDTLDTATAKHTTDISNITAQQAVTESKLCTNLDAAQTLAAKGADGQIITVLENNKATVYVVSNKQLVSLVTDSNTNRTFESKNAMEAAMDMVIEILLGIFNIFSSVLTYEVI